MVYRKVLGKEEAFAKLKHYCAYQERSHQEVKQKAYNFGLRKDEVEELTSRLIEEDYLNEERFARAYARGHFRMKQWGRVKIVAALKEKRTSSYCIKKALEEIPEEEYRQTASRLAEARWKSIKGAGQNNFTKMAKTRDHLLRKGFEPALVNQLIQSLSGKSG